MIWLPHISNFDDFDPLRMVPGVHLRYVRRVEDLGQPAAILLPGTKSTLNDLAWLHESGFSQAIPALQAKGVSVEVVGSARTHEALLKQASVPALASVGY